MAAQVQFVELSEQDRQEAEQLARLAEGDLVEMRIRRSGGGEVTLPLPPGAAALIEALLSHLSRGERVAVLTEDQELSPNDAAGILGMSRPLVVHRMDIGDLPYRYVGKYRRTTLRDVLTFKAKIHAQRSAMESLAADADDLARHGV